MHEPKKDTLPPCLPFLRFYLHGLKNRIIPAQDTVASERTSFQWPVWMPFSQLTAVSGGKQLRSPQGLVFQKPHPFLTQAQLATVELTAGGPVPPLRRFFVSTALQW